MSQMQATPQTPTSKNIAGLLFYFLLIISICLTAFNFYLFAWIWSNAFGGTAGGGAASLKNFAAPEQTSDRVLVSQLNLMARNDRKQQQQQDDVIDFSSKLVSGKTLDGALVEGIGTSRDSESSALRLMSRSEIQLGLLSDNLALKFAPSLIVSGKQARIAFPNGLLVRDRDTLKPQISCGGHLKSRDGEGDDDNNHCRLKANKIKLTGDRLNFSNKSLQLKRVHTRRLHSPMHKLQLMCSNTTKLASKSRSVHLQALDAIALGSRNAKVIIKAKTIDVGAKLIVAKQGRQTARRPANGYKLCVCLAAFKPRPEVERTTAAAAGAAANSSSQRVGQPLDRLGRLFAVQDGLKCGQFSAAVCNPFETAERQARHRRL